MDNWEQLEIGILQIRCIAGYVIGQAGPMRTCLPRNGRSPHLMRVAWCVQLVAHALNRWCVVVLWCRAVVWCGHVVEGRAYHPPLHRRNTH